MPLRRLDERRVLLGVRWLANGGEALLPHVSPKVQGVAVLNGGHALPQCAQLPLEYAHVAHDDERLVVAAEVDELAN